MISDADISALSCGGKFFNIEIKEENLIFEKLRECHFFKNKGVSRNH
jgi:hypothetical protein